MFVQPGTLYVVATPIGNLHDLSPRARDVLATVGTIAAEDTRHTRQLLRHFGIDTPLISLHDHNERDRCGELVATLAAGASLALVSDAGTPLVSDPGYHLVCAAHAADVPVVAVPGPSSLIAALSIAGLPTDRFVFEGFLPARGPARRVRLEALEREERTLVFFESSHRIGEMLEDLVAIFGSEREAVIARELTKRFEETLHGTLPVLAEKIVTDAERRRGEFVVLVRGAPPLLDEVGADAMRTLSILLEELPVRQAAAITARLTGLKKNLLYARALEMAAHKSA